MTRHGGSPNIIKIESKNIVHLVSLRSAHTQIQIHTHVRVFLNKQHYSNIHHCSISFKKKTAKCAALTEVNI